LSFVVVTAGIRIMADEWCCCHGSSTTWMTVMSRGKLKRLQRFDCRYFCGSECLMLEQLLIR